MPILGQGAAVAPTPSPLDKALRDGAEASERRPAVGGPSQAWGRPSAARPPCYHVLVPGGGAAGPSLRPLVLGRPLCFFVERREWRRVAERCRNHFRGVGVAGRVGCWAAGREAGLSRGHSPAGFWR